MASPVAALLLLFHLLLPHSSLSSKPTAFESSLIHQACHATADFDSCTTRLLVEREHPDLPPGPTRLLHAVTRGAINEALRAIETISGVTSLPSTRRERAAVDDCMELLDYSVDELAQSLAQIARLNYDRETNVRSWLSAALGNQDTCLEGFDGTDGRIRHYIRSSLGEVTQVVGNLLTVYRLMRSILPVSRGNGTTGADLELPPWIVDEEMEMLRADPRALRVDAVVAADGSGEFRTLGEAVARAPSHSLRRYVIFVKEGVYKENIELKRRKTNIMLVGEGMGVTVITGNRNFMQGWTTFRTATFGKALFGILVSLKRDV